MTIDSHRFWDNDLGYMVIEPPNEPTENFDPEQPRVPAGSPDGGEWSPTGAIAARTGLVPATPGQKLLDGRPVPPAWQQVFVSNDPKSDLQAVGIDSKGRVVRVYSKEFTAAQGDAKFERVQELRVERDALFARARTDAQSQDPKVKEPAACLRLIQETGVRPGSTADTKAAKQAYGATTLEGRHVVDVRGKVHLRFTGKKGVALDIKVENEELAEDLRARREAAGRRGKLFDTSANDLREYTDSISGARFSPKDFRTLKGTEVAADMVSKLKRMPTDEKEYKKVVRGIAKEVSKRLGNTPTIALQSYINPRVFHGIKPKAA